MIKVYFGKSETNQHGTEKKGEPWNRQTVHGWKLRWLDIKGPLIKTGRKTSVIWYKRLILYFPSGAWWYFDIVVRGLNNES